MLQSYVYKHFSIAPSGPRVQVFDPRLPGDPAIFRTTSIVKAEEWVDAYRAGRVWAAVAREWTVAA